MGLVLHLPSSSRLGSHSSSDDQKLYQDMEQVEEWKTRYHPVTRLRGYLEQRGFWDEGREEELRERVMQEIHEAIQHARGELRPHPDYLFKDVYDHLPPRLERQRQEMWAVVNKYPEHYPLKKHES